MLRLIPVGTRVELMRLALRETGHTCLSYFTGKEYINIFASSKLWLMKLENSLYCQQLA